MARKGRDRAATVRRVVQAISCVAFALYVAWPLISSPGELIYRADAVAAVPAALAVRAAFAGLVFTLALLASAYVFGRAFCGWVCPLGSAVDAVDLVVGQPLRGRRLAGVKVHLLVVLLGLAACGVAVAWWLAPMGWAARLLSAAAPARLDLVAVVAAALVVAISSAALGRRGFCRVLCPLGAGLGAIARLSPLERRVSEGCVECGLCTEHCRAGALGRGPRDWDRAECIHCRVCEAVCPEGAVSFGYAGRIAPVRPDLPGRRYLISAGGAIAAGLAVIAAREPEASPSRAPGTVPDDELAARCIRCGACTRACPTGGLVPDRSTRDPLLFETPRLSAREGGCAFECNACGRACPTGAIAHLPLPRKQRVVLGCAHIRREACRVYARGEACLECYAACPLHAVRFRTDGRLTSWGDPLLLPWIDRERCTGCGLCEARCPVAGKGAILTEPVARNPILPGTARGRETRSGG